MLMRRIIALVLALGLALPLALLAVYSTSAGAATDQLPDLGMARLDHIQTEKTNGQRLLRFDTVIVNTGAGAFELHGSRPDTSQDMSVTQRIFDGAGGYRDRETTATMYWAGDGHTHWHVRDLEEYELIRLDNGKKVGTGAKEGFCFSDNRLFNGSAEPAYYTTCGHDPDALEVTMGLSRGWGDIYSWKTVGQYIDITGLTSGRYRLQAKADAGGWFTEEREDNNFTWADIKISGNSISVKRYGPAAEPI